jgi:hypothetical protein
VQAGPVDDDAPSLERAARNEARFRQANEEIDARRHELGVTEPFPVLCECARELCTAILRVAPDDYRATRASGRRFLVVPDHSDGAEIVHMRDGYAVIEKDGREAELVEAASSR